MKKNFLPFLLLLALSMTACVPEAIAFQECPPCVEVECPPCAEAEPCPECPPVVECEECLPDLVFEEPELMFVWPPENLEDYWDEEERRFVGLPEMGYVICYMPEYKIIQLKSGPEHYLLIQTTPGCKVYPPFEGRFVDHEYWSVNVYDIMEIPPEEIEDIAFSISYMISPGEIFRDPQEP